ncbi:helix-turn-helix domain-containing protein [Lapillicoccus jejuensis]|uniref:Transcriptional regulator with XRE-family HTH domain n=1 Tax=Lapillicoccus jejuensis TaxID=402171 RepID=A0A542DXV7_9MICO|nr:helix-turn-helix transcriptional regulator [Lapillicoccus jejuensis]TQJ07764.1 transcriptional regulator with XRE-family HTH domain [Lapillicoccus jejuensis]
MIEVAGSLGAQLGAALRTERFLRSTSQRALARELGVSKSFIGRLESGDLTGSAAAVARLVERLGLAFAIVVPDEDLGAAMVDDSPQARELAERWRRSASARHDGGSCQGDDPVPDEDGAQVGGQGGGAGGGAGGGQGGGAGGGAGDPAGAEHDRPAPGPHPPRRDDPGIERAPEGPPGWLLSSRHPEELTVPGQPPPTRAGRRVVVGTPAAWRSLRLDRFYDDPVAQVVAESWQRRAEAERVRDAAGRRMPAHVVCFPLQLPRMWWPCRHIGWDWRRRPIWSWRRHPLWVVEVLVTGPNPPPVGAHPFGGCPLQGHPSEDTRGDWPPDPSRRADPQRRRRRPGTPSGEGGAHWPA